VTPDPADAAPAPISTRKLAHALIIATLVILALVSAAIPIAWGLLARTPSWWRAPDPHSESAMRGAEAVERAFSGQFAERHDPGIAWSIEVTEDAANAWLNHRLPLWLDHEGIELPWPVEGIDARFTESAVRIGVARPADRTPRIVGVTIHPRIDPGSGAMQMTVRTLHLGSLSIPGALASRVARVFLDLPRTSDLGGMLTSGRSLDLRPIPVQDGHAVELIGIAPHPGRIRLTFRSVDGSASGGLP